jgi:hypothetical protein
MAYIGNPGLASQVNATYCHLRLLSRTLACARNSRNAMVLLLLHFILRFLYMWIQKEITLNPRTREFHLITDEIVSQLPTRSPC